MAKVTKRTCDKMVGIVFDLEEIANRLADDGHGDQEAELRDAANQVHRIAHRVLDRLYGATVNPDK